MPRLDKKSKVEVIACHDCRALGVSVNDRRITNHKCSGRWEVLAIHSVYNKTIREAVTDK